MRRRGTWYFADGGCPALNPAVMMSVGGGLAVLGWAVKSRTTVWTSYFLGERGEIRGTGEVQQCRHRSEVVASVGPLKVAGWLDHYPSDDNG